MSCGEVTHSMKLGSKCTVCGSRLTDGDLVECGDCGKRLHERCVEYEQRFECRTCGDEQWIGAVEF